MAWTDDFGAHPEAFTGSIQIMAGGKPMKPYRIKYSTPLGIQWRTVRAASEDMARQLAGIFIRSGWYIVEVNAM